MSKQKADLEDGYTRIANDLIDALIQKPLTLRELKVLLFIIRHTYGYHHKEHSLSHRFIAVGTGIDPKKVAVVLGELEKKKVILRKKSHGSIPQIVSINTHIGDWLLSPEKGDKESVLSPKSGYPKKGDILSPKLGEYLIPQKGDKNNIDINIDLKKECGGTSSPGTHFAVFGRLADEWKYSHANIDRIPKRLRAEIEGIGYTRMTDARLRYEDDFENRTTKNNQALSFRTWAEGAYKDYLAAVDENGIWYNINGQKCKGEKVYE
jgi:phage replication O-like protein O